MDHRRKKYRIYYKLEEQLEIPMFFLSIFWLYLFIVEMAGRLDQWEEHLIYIIWGVFIVEFLLKLILAPRRLQFIKNNWITVIALVVPAFRVLRIFNALRFLQSVRFINSANIIRALTSGRRFFTEVKEAQGPKPTPEMNVGILLALGERNHNKEMSSYAEQLIADVKPELERSTGTQWFFTMTDPAELTNDETKVPSDFLDPASLRMAEGPYDMVCVITDVPLMSRKRRIEPGLCSSVARTLVISSRKFTSTGRKKEMLSLNSEKVRYNTALLFLHLTGHIMGLKEKHISESKIMSTASFDQELKAVPSFSAAEDKILKKRAERAPDRELKEANLLESFVFHLLMNFRHFKELLKPLVVNKAFLLPLYLPALATAAVAPGFIFVFTAEIWDVGMNMSNRVTTVFAVMSIGLSSFYLVKVQNLFLPRNEKKILTEHLAVANSVIYLSVLMACIGLFLMLVILMLVIELYVFPPDLMYTWLSVGKDKILLEDKIRLAAFISTVGVVTGALAGGLESRIVIRHLALFRKRV